MSVASHDLTQIQGELARRSLTRFFKDAWHVMDPAKFEDTWHLDALCEFLQYVSSDQIRRLIVSMPPRMTKSLSCSVAWPVWEWIDRPETQFLTSSYDLNLSTRDALKSRRLIESNWFRDRWGGNFKIRKDENQKSRYSNTSGGHRIAITSSGRTTGEGGDIILLDDSHNASEVYSDVKRQSVIDWYDNTMRSRLNNQNTGGIVHVGQRTHETDVIGHVLKKEGRCTVEDNGKWVHLVMPNEFRPATRCVLSLPKEIKKGIKDPDYEPKVAFEDPRTEKDELLCPGRLGRAATEALKPPVGMTLRDYNSQYQQDPAADDGLILKRSWWIPWEYPEYHPDSHKRRPMPHCEIILQIYDTAFEEQEENDYSARTTWGVFVYTPEKMHPATGKIERGKDKRCAILLDAWRDKIPFPDLRRDAIESYDDWNPDWVLIEKKASGHSLIQELRKSGVPVKAVDPKGKDKVLRAHLSSAPLEQGCVFWVPGHNDAVDVIEECAKFPVAEYDDYTDTVVMLLAWLRRMGSIDYFDEDEGELNLFKPRRERGIYG
jgi:predicted phage terminase large subunit-like protein